MNNLFDLTDDSLLAFYESVRRQVVADDKLGGRRLAGATVKEYENRLKTEMDRRRLHFKPMTGLRPDTLERGAIHVRGR